MIGGVKILVDSTGMGTVHTTIKDGKTDLTTVGKVMKISIHGIHYIINTMKSMNTNHLNKMNLLKDKDMEAERRA